ncbi:MAG: hypothetical protein SCH71_08945 [Desulfobulbaceae bacterium]|nr:hypothetical protein [Desulfobulbaceae bacterium]
MKHFSTGCILFLVGTILTLFLFSSRVNAADEEGCAICHKYSGLARIDQQTGKIRLFYVTEEKYQNSVHGKVLCRNCHLNLDKIPHNDAQKVDCSTKCHLKEPSTEIEFSHSNLYEEVNLSIHGKGTPEDAKKYLQDMPGCTDCHKNTVYQPVQGFEQDSGISQDALRRCIGCHTKEEWANRYYQHFTHRLHRSKTSIETVNLCLNCHQDAQMMNRHELPATANYRDTYHWKGVMYGDQNAPDCISCHAPVGYSVHSLKSMQSKESAVHPQNLRQTCANTEGTQQCHPRATESFARGKIHKTGLGFDETVAAFVKGEAVITDISALRKERRFRNLMEIDDEELSALNEQERFQFTVYMIVKYVYTLLITVVIGGMLIHQLMDLYRTVKNRNNH